MANTEHEQTAEPAKCDDHEKNINGSNSISIDEDTVSKDEKTAETKTDSDSMEEQNTDSVKTNGVSSNDKIFNIQGPKDVRICIDPSSTVLKTTTTINGGHLIYPSSEKDLDVLRNASKVHIHVTCEDEGKELKKFLISKWKIF